jgi:hypothetical protein
MYATSGTGADFREIGLPELRESIETHVDGWTSEIEARARNGAIRHGSLSVVGV